MNRCLTCKHWEGPTRGYGRLPGTGKCKAMVQFWNATEWTEDCNSRKLKSEHVGKLAFVKDASDYYAELMTLPDFGCVLHDAL